MKISHIIAIVVIAAAVGIIISSTGEAGTYVTFDQAEEMSDNGMTSNIHVVGQLKKNKAGEIVGIHPSPDKLTFSFIMVDEDNREQMVYYGEPMPPDFMRSEQVVVIGSYTDNDLFKAEKILLKCPSKYQEETIDANS